MTVKSKRKNKSVKKASSTETTDIDERFAAALSRPQFRREKEQENKVILDERFASVLTDPRFSVQLKDKYGRKAKQTLAFASDLKEFYGVEKNEGGEPSQDNDKADRGEQPDDAIPTNENSYDDDSDDNSQNDDQNQDPTSRIAYLTALSRGELDLSSSSEDDDDSDSSDDDSDSPENDIHGKAGILDPSTREEEDDVSISFEPSPYIAVLNMDWLHVRAVDLFAILSSFTPPGAVRKVQVYPSDYGLERMEKEKILGPLDVWKKSKSRNDQEEDDDSEGEPDTYEGTPEVRFEVEEDLETGFDSEKLRAYEASKLKYYFAIVEFASPEAADVAYKEIDGLELEHSSASIDMRTIPSSRLDAAKRGRELRDEALTIPSNYEPPDFVVNALQQTNIQCTWDEGDVVREKKLTQYGSGQGWQELGESDDLRAYLASDHSSDDDSEASRSDVSDANDKGKASKLRNLLGLDDDHDEIEDRSVGEIRASESDEEIPIEASEVEGEKEITFVPGTRSLEDRIRLMVRGKEQEGLTPWQKYLEKRKQKRRERRQAARDRLQEEQRGEYEDEFFVDEGRDAAKGDNRAPKAGVRDHVSESNRAPSSKEELALLVAGEEDQEDTRDYDMHDLVKLDKLKGKNLKGARKRKTDILSANLRGGDFKINTKDNRFAAVLQGTDDRFGIDRTDPSFRDTDAMREILAEQTKRRKARKRAKKGHEHVTPDVNAEMAESSGVVGGAAALSSLVKSLKKKVGGN
jgi:hypothetical protein